MVEVQELVVVLQVPVEMFRIAEDVTLVESPKLPKAVTVYEAG